MRKLRIAAWYNLPSGGAKRALYDHVRGLVQRGHHLETWRPPILHEHFASLGELVEEHVVPLEMPPGGSSYASKIRAHVARTGRLIEAMQAHSRRCAAEIDAGGFDLLFSNTCMHFSAPFIGRHSNLPSALYLQEPHRPFYEPLPRLPLVALPEELLRERSLHGLKKRIRDRYDLQAARLQSREERDNAASYDRILVNSYFSREALLRAYGLNSEVCYLGIDTERFRDLDLPRERFVIGLGTIGPTKNVRLAIESVGAIPKASRPPLVWVGNMSDDVYMQEMRELADRLEVDYRTRVMASDEEVVELLNTAAAMLYAPRLEPFGLAPLEANACGCPVVAVPEGGVRETIVDGVNGRLVPHDPEAIGQALVEVLDNPVRAREMGQEARRLVLERWTLERSVDRIEQALLRTAG